MKLYSYLLILTLTVKIVASENSIIDNDSKWKEFKIKYNKEFSSNEETTR